MFMKRKIKSVKGFTLAELLIVVAIIAVLVAIGIPIFTSQLEKSREAVDLSDVRSAYAEVMMAAITGDTTAIYTKDANQMIYKKEANVYSITVKPLKQKQDGWQTALPITIGGVSSTDNVHWVGTPGANGECVIKYIPPTGAVDEAVKFEWKGGTDVDNGSNNPSENPGTNPSNPGNSTNSDYNDTNSIKDLNWGAIQYPEECPTGQSPFRITFGKVYKFKGALYVAKTNNGYTNNYDYCTPYTRDSWFVSPNKTTYTSADLIDKWGIGQKNILDNLQDGDLYKEGNTYYVFAGGGTFQNPPNPSNIKTPSNDGAWIKIDLSKSDDYQ
jgi:prepilin-type cleavage/methylation N-terminal domain protein